jgi:TolB-like protein/Tfp pilus assembly protein PilF
MSLVSELRRRNVLRMAVLYAVAAWLIMQVAEVMMSLVGLPAWAGRATFAVLAVGFPIALIFSWFYELTPEGVKLEKDIDPTESITHVTGRRLEFIVISLLCAGLILFAYDKWWISPPPEQSIAVLPFQNMSGDPAQDYFSDGLSDTLIHVLAQVSGLKVTAKTSSFYFKGKNIDVGEIARQLKVGTILEGSVQKAGNRVRVIAQLVNAADGTHLWSISFDRDLEDIFAVQDEIAREVVKALKVTLLDTEEERLAQRYKPTLEVYEQLILGRHEMAKRTATSLAAAEQHFKQAIELDPDYALAYVDLAGTYGLQIFYGSLITEKSLQLRQPLVDKALQLDPLSGEAHIAKAHLRSHQRIKTGQENFRAVVEEDILKAIQLSPNYVEARRWYSILLHEQGRFEEALAEIRLAAELDPMSPVIQLGVADATWDVGRAEEAMTLIRRNMERNPEFPPNYSTMAIHETQLGHLGAAQRWIQEAGRRNPDDAYSWWIECAGFLNLGDVQSAERCAKRMRAVHPEKVVSGSIWWLIHRYRGEWNAAIATLESVSERVPGFRPFKWFLPDLIAGQGDVERARRLMADAFPELLEPGPELAVADLEAALVFATILHANGETQRRDILLLALEERIATLHRIRGHGYGILDVYIHAIRGDRDRAIAGLREAIDVGWRVSGDNPEHGCWWMLRQDWKLTNLHQDPEFIAMVNELEEDIRRQRQWYEENKDDPLF